MQFLLKFSQVTLVVALSLPTLMAWGAETACRDAISISSILSSVHDPEIRTLLNDSQFQEAAWLAERKGDLELSTALIKYIEEKLKTASVISRDYMGAGASESFVIELEGRLKGVFKPEPKYWTKKNVGSGWVHNTHAEVDMYQAVRLLNLSLVPVTIERVIDGKEGSFQVFILRDHQKMPDEMYGIMKAVDYLFNNRDRHGNNYLEFDGRPILIDNSVTFQPIENGRGFHPPWKLDQFKFDPTHVEEQKFYRALGTKDFPKKMGRLLRGHHSGTVIKEILLRRKELLKAFESQGFDKLEEATSSVEQAS